MASEIQKKQDTPLAIIDYGDDAGAGYENQSAADMAMQFVNVLQKMSPQLEESDGLFIEGAKEGDLYNTVTNELLPQGTEFIPGITEHVYVEWIPRDEGGGFVARHAMDSPLVVKAKANYKFGEWKTDGGNDLIETFYIYGVLVMDGGQLIPAVIAFAKTKIKVYKGWNTKIRAFQVILEDGRRQTPPLFAHRVALGSVNDSNPKGKFKNLSLAPAGGSLTNSLITQDDARYLAARKVRDMVKGGTAKVDFDQQNGPAGEVVTEDDVPF